MSEENEIIKVYNISGRPIRLDGFGLREHGDYWHMTTIEAKAVANDPQFSTKTPKGEASAPKPIKEVTE